MADVNIPRVVDTRTKETVPKQLSILSDISESFVPEPPFSSEKDDWQQPRPPLDTIREVAKHPSISAITEAFALDPPRRRNTQESLPEAKARIAHQYQHRRSNNTTNNSDSPKSSLVEAAFVESETIVVNESRVAALPDAPSKRLAESGRVPSARNRTDFQENTVSFSKDEEAGCSAADTRNPAPPPTTTTKVNRASTKPDPTLPRRRKWRILGIGAAVLLVIAAVTVGSVLLTRKKRIRFVQHLDGSRPNDNFGSAVALSSLGNRLAVASAGTVTVYNRDLQGDGLWEPIGEAIVVDPNPPVDGLTQRTHSMAIDLDKYGDTLVVGYTVDDDSSVGLVQIHRLWEGSWRLVASLVTSEGVGGDQFGASVSLNKAGDMVAVGSPGYRNSTGRVYVYETVGGSWEPQGDIVGKTMGAELGCSISMSARGNRIAAGSRTIVGTNNVVAQVYEFGRDGGSSWSSIVGFDHSKSMFSTVWMVDLSADGNRIVVSNSYTEEEDFINTDPDSLLVQALEYDGTSWKRLGENIHQGISGPKSGYFVSLSDDGLTMVMGDPGTSTDENVNNGHAHIYKFVGGSWEQHGPNVDGEMDGDKFGSSVAINGDGSHFVVGAPFRNLAANDAGRVGTFDT